MRIEINGRTVECKEGQTILEVACENGITIPTLCHFPGLPPSGACRVCIVEVEGRPSLIASCAYPVTDGMKVRTNTSRVRSARKTIVQLLLANHKQECASCIRNGNCELQALAREVGVRDVPFVGDRRKAHKDISSPSIARDPEKCILCGRCVRACEEIQGVGVIDFTRRGFQASVSTAFDDGLNVTECVNCGQCIKACPTGALHENVSIGKVWAALSDPTKIVVFQHAPAISVSIGEEFGMSTKADMTGVLTAALKEMGAEYVFDTSFTADLTIMEETGELIQRVKDGGPFPMFTSCSPGWVKFIEHRYPQLLPNVSTCKSPQQMLGALIKTYFSTKLNVDPSKVFSVSIMPCTAKKFEAQRPEHGRAGYQDIDAVLTTREAAEMIREAGIDLKSIPPVECDNPFGERTGAGKIFGATGGVSEAALRTAYHLLTGTELEKLEISQMRGLDGVKTFSCEVNGIKLRTAIVSGLANVARLIDRVQAGEESFHLIEVMACPGGCINGGGQPYASDDASLRRRMEALYKIDANAPKRVSHDNEWVKRLYEEFLLHPGSHVSHELLHTHYQSRKETVAR
ncbi:MAG: NADH-dependent [FeFe] hydrogenase, group A6 [Candidatus Brocadiia bacterium]